MKSKTNSQDGMMNVSGEWLDEYQEYVQMQQKIKQLLITCESLKHKGLGGEPVKKAAKTIEDLLQSLEKHDLQEFMATEGGDHD